MKFTIYIPYGVQLFLGVTDGGDLIGHMFVLKDQITILTSYLDLEQKFCGNQVFTTIDSYKFHGMFD